MKGSVFLVSTLLISLLCGSIVCGSGSGAGQVEKFAEFNNTDFNKVFDDQEGHVILHVYNGTCVGRCQQELKLLESNIVGLKGLPDKTRFISANIAKSRKAFRVLDIVSDSGVFYLFKGMPIRLDRNDYKETKENEFVNFFDDLKKALTKDITPIESADQLSKLLKAKTPFFIYFGDSKPSFYFDIQVATKLTNHTIYQTNDTALAASINVKHPKFLYTHFPARNVSIQMRPYPTFRKIEKFLDRSTIDIPRKFDITKISESIQHGHGVLLIKGENSEEEKKIFGFLSEIEDFVRNYFHVYVFTNKAEPEQKEYSDYCTAEKNPQKSTICVLKETDGVVARYIYQRKNLTLANVGDFLIGYTGKTLTPYVQSELIKVKWNGNLRNLNTYSVNKFFTTKNSYDSASRIVYFYKNDCSECDNVSKILEAIANDADKEELVFARINTDKNELTIPEKYEFPALVGYLAFGNETATKYSGKWDEASIKTFVETVKTVRQEALKELTEGKVDL